LAAIGAVTVCHRIADIIFEPKIFDPNSSSARFSNQSNEAGRYTKGSQKSIGESRGGAMTASFFRRGCKPWPRHGVAVQPRPMGALANQVASGNRPGYFRSPKQPASRL
jgi:hypothetical protein